MGMIVSRPINSSVCYDRIVDCGNIYRVQIKCIWSAKKRGDKYQVFFRKNDNTKYSLDEVDIFAVYVKNYNCWYIIPNIGMTTSVNYDHYKENWEQFKKKPWQDS